MKFGYKISDVKKMFFDREAVFKYLIARQRKVFNKFGGFVRTIAKRSMRYGDRISSPGNPPTARKGKAFLRKFLYYAYDIKTKSVVIGPARLNSVIGFTPPALEYGGENIIQSRGKIRKANIRKRPYMKPAFDAGLTKLDSFWKDVR